MDYIIRDAGPDDGDAVMALMPRLADFDVPASRNPADLYRDDAKLLQRWLKQIVRWQAYTSDAIGEALRDQVILPKLQDLIAEFMMKQEITILKLAAYYDELGVELNLRVVGATLAPEEAAHDIRRMVRRSFDLPVRVRFVTEVGTRAAN